eukprot:PhM_4_TR9256/c0_g1_i1/m.76936
MASYLPSLGLQVLYPTNVYISSVADISDKSRPMIQSTRPPTKGCTPSFEQDEEIQRRENIKKNMRILAQEEKMEIRSRAEAELDMIREDEAYAAEEWRARTARHHHRRAERWDAKMMNSPLWVNLAADSKRIQRERRLREMDQKKRTEAANRMIDDLEGELLRRALLSESEHDVRCREQRERMMQVKQRRVAQMKERTDQRINTAQERIRSIRQRKEELQAPPTPIALPSPSSLFPPEVQLKKLQQRQMMMTSRSDVGRLLWEPSIPGTASGGSGDNYSETSSARTGRRKYLDPPPPPKPQPPTTEADSRNEYIRRRYQEQERQKEEVLEKIERVAQVQQKKREKQQMVIERRRQIREARECE